MAKKNTKPSQNSSSNENRKGKSKVLIREMSKAEITQTADLIARLKRLNGEFDPLLKTTEGLEDEARRVVERAASTESSLILVALSGSKVVGVVKADIQDRIFYEPRKEGAIDEFYILPEYRRGSLGRDLLASMTEMLKKKGADLITAEFPSQNEIAKRFYTKLEFRSLTNVYAKAES
jgi:ribosomal protein S18 acetylase RimI-like enzyme